MNVWISRNNGRKQVKRENYQMCHKNSHRIRSRFTGEYLKRVFAKLHDNYVLLCG